MTRELEGKIAFVTGSGRGLGNAMALRHIPVQMLTLDEDKQHGLARGAFDFISKPVVANELTGAIARVVDIEGSGPRDPGTAMAVSEDGEVAGSVSGGCVEGAVLTEALAVLDGDGAPRLVTFGYSDDEAFSVGLTCGGTIRVFVEPLEW